MSYFQWMSTYAVDAYAESHCYFYIYCICGTSCTHVFQLNFKFLGIDTSSPCHPHLFFPSLPIIISTHHHHVDTTRHYYCRHHHIIILQILHTWHIMHTWRWCEFFKTYCWVGMQMYMAYPMCNTCWLNVHVSATCVSLLEITHFGFF